jgi:uncharacterized protein with LGFP repeats
VSPAAFPQSRKRALVAVVAVVAVVAGAALGFPAPPAVADVTTIGVDNLRTSWDRTEPALTPSAVSSSTFGKLFSTAVDGQVYAQPLVIGNTVIAATENNRVYGMDAVTGAIAWSTNLGTPWPSSTLGCGDLAPNVGVTSTPVYDPATNSVVLLSKTIPAGGTAQSPEWYAHALDPATGRDRPGYPVRIAGSPTNDPSRPFLPLTAAQRPGLLLLDGVVYAGFASHCDQGPYVGYVVGIGTVSSTGKPGVTTMWATEHGSSNGEAGIWQSGGGLVADDNGDILLTTGNGISPQPGPGSSPPATLGESVVRLEVTSTGALTPVDFFSPANNAKLDIDDADLGSAAPLALPAGYGTAAVPHLVVQLGKDGRGYLLDGDNLGGMGQGPGGGDAALQTFGPYSGVWGKPAFFGGNGGYVYTVESTGYLRAFKLQQTGGVPNLAPIATSAGTLGYTSGSPVVTSTGSDPSSALVWVVKVADATGAGAQLQAYDAIPTNGVLTLRYSYALGVGAKFSSVATNGGRVYVGTRDGNVWAFGDPTTASLTSPPTEFGSVPVGAQRSATVTLTAARAVTVSSVAASAPFSAPSGGFTVAQGATVTVPVSFSTGTPGSVSGSLTLTTSTGEAIVLPLHAVATRTGVAATPTGLTFTDVPVGAAAERAFSVTNTGTAPVRVTAAAITGAGLTATGLPAVGAALDPQQSVTVNVHFEPGAVGSSTGNVTVGTDAGGSYASVSVPVTATAITGAAKMIVPDVVDAGTVAVGTSRTTTFTITNDGNIPMTITKAKAPNGAFTSATPLSEGLVVPPDSSIQQSVTFTPTSVGPAPDEVYIVTSDDGSGVHSVVLRGTGADDPIAAKVEQLGGTSYSSLLGNPVTGQTPVADGTVQRFQRGRIYWSAPTGAHLVTGAIAVAYDQLGGPGGVLGFPTSDETVAPDGAGRFNDFTVGSIYWSLTTGAHEVQGLIRQKWLAAGGVTGPDGYPVTDEQGTPDGIGRYNHFANGGSVYWSAATGAHEVHGAIRDAWAASGWEAGPLGYPVTDETVTADMAGRFNDFSAGGSVYWSPATGAHEVHGAIRAGWLATGGVTGPLGYPVTDELGTPDGVGRFNHFSNAGSEYWTPGTGAHAVYGLIRAAWAASGWETGPLGYPVTDESGTPDGVGRFNHFSGGGSVYWTPSTGAHLVYGAIRAAWAASGWETGPLGYPVTDEFDVPGGRRNIFQRGTLTFSWATDQVTPGA